MRRWVHLALTMSLGGFVIAGCGDDARRRGEEMPTDAAAADRDASQAMDAGVGADGSPGRDASTVDGGTPDAGSADGGPMDGGSMDGGMDDGGVDGGDGGVDGGDGGVDGGPDVDAGPPLRTFGTRPLFGDMPVENRFVDPQFEVFSGASWLAYSDTSERPYGHIRTTVTPTRQPILWVPARDDGASVTVLGQLAGRDAPFDVEVWVGRPSAAGDEDFSSLEAYLLGFFSAERTPQTIELADDGSRFEGGGFAWRRLSVSLDQGPIGFAYLLVSDGSSGTLVLTGPTATAGERDAPRLLSAPRRRRPTREQLEAVGVFERKAWDRLGRGPRTTPFPAMPLPAR